MRQHLHIKDRVVEAGEYKRRFQARQTRHVARGGLARLVLQIHQLMVDHEVDKFAGFRADLVVHLLRGLDHERVVTRRLSVAIRKYHLFVVPHDVINAKALGLRVIELLAQRNKNGAYLLAERRDLFFAVIRASLLQITDRNVIFVAKIFAHLVADTNQLIPNLFQTRLIVLIKFGVCLDGSGAHRAVRVFKVFLHAVKVQLLAVKRNLCRGHDFLIFIGQAALLLAQRNVGLAIQLFL